MIHKIRSWKGYKSPKHPVVEKIMKRILKINEKAAE